MASTPIPYARRETYEPNRTLAGLLLRQGDQSADRWARAGDIVAGTLGSIARQRAEAPILAQQAQLRDLQLRQGQQGIQQGDQELQMRQQAMAAAQREDGVIRQLFSGQDLPTAELILQSGIRPERAQILITGLDTARKLHDGQVGDARTSLGNALRMYDAAPEDMRPGVWSMIPHLATAAGIPPEAVAQPSPEAITALQRFLSAPKIVEHDPTKARIDEQSGAVVTPAVPAPKAPEKVTFAQPQPLVIGGRTVMTRAGSDGQIYDMAGQVVAGAETARPYVAPSTAQGPQPGYQWVIRNGKQVYTNRVQDGDVPASRSGGGRNVIAGDAEDLSNLDTSLDDIATLKTTISGNGATGTAAKVGAMLPNAVTDLTGWGTAAKQKQAVIDRVKQVIGKTLEGGVLRKEDEAKYEKILPTIADTAAVVTTKLDGLKAAIEQRKARRLDAMDDAGFDVTKYRARDPKPAATAAPARGTKVGRFTVEVEP